MYGLSLPSISSLPTMLMPSFPIKIVMPCHIKLGSVVSVSWTIVGIVVIRTIGIIRTSGINRTPRQQKQCK
jgi:hypothetical protein